MKRILAIVGMLAIAATVVQAAWTRPTQDQINAAAQDPSRLPALLRGADAQQAASVIVAALQRAAATTPPAGRTREVIVTQIVTLGLRDQSQQAAMAIAQALGTQLGTLAPVVPAIAAIIGTVQTALESLPQVGAMVAGAFTASFNAAVRAAAQGKPVE
jgi:hypothetical protein